MRISIVLCEDLGWNHNSTYRSSFSPTMALLMDWLEPALLDTSRLVDLIRLGVHTGILLVTIVRSLRSHLLYLLAVRNTLK